MAVSSWSTARLAAETVVVPVEETDVGAAAGEVSQGAGGVILFGTSAPTDLGTALGSLERSVPGRHGLLVMTDEEGGGIQRMANLVGSLPWPKEMAATLTPAEITSVVSAVARKMSGYGVNMDLAPVVDVDGRDVLPGPSDPDGLRSFSGSTSVVTTDGMAFARGLEQGGVIPVLKHFPGLGGASGNTDVEAAHTLAWSTLEQVALPPFVAGIAAGVPAIMVSNATVPGLTSLPASLSSAAIEKELVGALHFHGLVVTDSLSAAAISAAGYSVPAAAVAALRAGADMTMYTGSSGGPSVSSLFSEIVATIVRAVRRHSLGRGRLVAAATAVLAVRHVRVCP